MADKLEKEVINAEIGNIVNSATDYNIDIYYENLKKAFDIFVKRVVNTATIYKKELVEALPTQEELKEIAVYNFALELKINGQVLEHNKTENDHITIEEIEKQVDVEGETIKGSLLEQAEIFATLFTKALREEVKNNEDIDYFDLFEEAENYFDKEYISIYDFASSIDFSNNPKLKILQDCILQAQKSDLLDLQQFAGDGAAELEHIKYHPLNNIKAVLDKTNAVFYGIEQPILEKDVNGQYKFLAVNIGAENKKQVQVKYSYTIDEEMLNKLGISKKFTKKDKLIISIIDSYRESGNEYITLTQLYKALNGTKKSPNSTQLKNLEQDLTRLLSTILTLDTKEVAEAYSIENYQEYKGQLLPIAILNEKKVINGQIVNSAIKILDEAPLVRLAKNINQVTAIPPELLAVNVTHTDKFYNILDYLITEISHIKNPRYPKKNKILYSTLYDKCGINKNSSKEINRALPIVFKILDHFKECDFITGYKEEKTASTGEYGVVIMFNEANKKKITAK